MHEKTKCLSVLCLSLMFLCLFANIPSISATQGDLWGGNPQYLRREDSTTQNATWPEPDYYQVLNTSAPTNATPITFTSSGSIKIGEWITLEDYYVSLDNKYIFEFSFWAYASVNNTCKLKVALYKFIETGTEIEIPLENQYSEYLITGSYVNVVWQSRTSEEVIISTKVVLKVWFEASEGGTFYFRYDGTSYKAYVSDPIETRYFRAEYWTINGLNARKLITSQGVSAGYVSHVGDYTKISYLGIRVYKRTSAGVETQINSTTTAHAIVSRSTIGYGYQSNTFVCALTSLSSTDSIVIKAYFKWGTGAWTLEGTWTTEQLGAQSLDFATWTVYYYTERREYDLFNDEYAFGFGVGEITYNSRIENFLWTPVPIGQTYSLYHSLNLIIDLSHQKKGIYNRYSDLSIDLGLSQQKQGIYSRYSNLNIDLGLSEWKRGIYNRYSAINIVLDIAQFFSMVALEPSMLIYFIMFLAGVVGFCFFLAYEKKR